MKRRRSPSSPVLGPWLLYLITLSFLSPRRRTLLIRSVILSIVILLVSFVTLVVFLASNPPTNEEEYQALRWNTPETDEHWIKVIKEGKFISSHIFKPLESAISEKFIVILEYEGERYKTMVKPIEDPRWIGYIGETFNLHHHLAEGEGRVHRRHSDTRKYQGFPELAAYHVDRVLGYYRKPPFIGRVFNSKELYENWVHINQLRMKDIFRSLSYKFDAVYSQHNIYVAQSPWMEGIMNKPLPSSIKDMLNFNAQIKLETMKKDELFYYEMLSVSDTLVFDYLVDEHDRKEDKNWVVSLNNPHPKYQSTYLIWDNGLSFDHGPVGRKSCFDILCGSTIGNEERGCKKICRFSNTTITKLRNFQENSNFGKAVKESISHDIFSPVFHMGVYEKMLYDLNPVSFIADNFFDGLDVKLDLLLKHVDSCISLYGEAEVLLPE